MVFSVACFVWSLLSAWFTGISGLAAAEDTFKIGLPIAVTGKLSGYGIGEVEAAKIAVKEINAAGGVLGKNLELLHYDTASDHRQTVNIVRKLIQQDGVSLICGPLSSQESKVTFPIIEKAKVIAMSPSSLAPGLTDGLTYCFRNTAAEDKLVPKCRADGPKTVGHHKGGGVPGPGRPVRQGYGRYFHQHFERKQCRNPGSAAVSNRV